MFLTDFSIKVKGLALAKQRQLEEYKATYAQQVVMMMMIMNGNGDDVDGDDDDDNMTMIMMMMVTAMTMMVSKMDILIE